MNTKASVYCGSARREFLIGSSVLLAGAVNTQTACLPHTGMFTEIVYQQVRAFIAP